MINKLFIVFFISIFSFHLYSQEITIANESMRLIFDADEKIFFWEGVESNIKDPNRWIDNHSRLMWWVLKDGKWEIQRKGKVVYYNRQQNYLSVILQFKELELTLTFEFKNQYLDIKQELLNRSEKEMITGLKSGITWHMQSFNANPIMIPGYGYLDREIIIPSTRVNYWYWVKNDFSHQNIDIKAFPNIVRNEEDIFDIHFEKLNLPKIKKSQYHDNAKLRRKNQLIARKLRGNIMAYNHYRPVKIKPNDIKEIALVYSRGAMNIEKFHKKNYLISGKGLPR